MIPPISPCTASAPFDDVRFVVVIVTSVLRGLGAAADRRSRPSRAGAVVLRGLGAAFAAARPRNPPTAPHDGSPSSSLKIGE